MTNQREYTPTFLRSKATWLQMLRGDYGVEQQRTAMDELTHQFSMASQTCLRNRRTNTKQIADWTNEDVARYAQKVVDATLTELLLDDFAEFDAFDETRLFLVQAAQLVIDHIAADLGRR